MAKESETLKSEVYRVTRDYVSPYPNPVVFREGEKVKIGREFKDDPDWKDWVWCGRGGKKAWVPKQYLTVRGLMGSFRKDYNAMELSVKVGETLVVHDVVNGFGMSEKADGTRGWVPMRNIKLESSHL